MGMGQFGFVDLLVKKIDRQILEDDTIPDFYICDYCDARTPPGPNSEDTHVCDLMHIADALDRIEASVQRLTDVLSTRHSIEFEIKRMDGG